VCNKDGGGGLGGGNVESGGGKRERGCGGERLREIARALAEFIETMRKEDVN
jgi:hypothetical protein